MAEQLGQKEHLHENQGMGRRGQGVFICPVYTKQRDRSGLVDGKTVQNEHVHGQRENTFPVPS